MISVEKLKVEFGIKPLFQDASFVINDNDKVALVGKKWSRKIHSDEDTLWSATAYRR